ncbi:putative ubiquinone biosynthesis monooxygenase [Friedmanniomyces endolithicus]|uniref:Ubiquinone biosynthesis monooxygenase COQ6, mitochondrial n=1 Tax=Friedmanniomyces endolithicus TaxID=329885 RepID=A0AAN6QXQ0_9PEZI|nr:putative ubiquinone biosynthesis monooxygenase [Friedmanniomyces endolithicus]KAK0792106.1 putative ubiquinone biosynthesis monooxygenase [Friedmanniomyces endolithicus]KAK0794125.1 putative ubiquinone biosynthesis monooxygenase [Friedmanniomyces endolithicus]KAK0808993.1 putative ubiquinone biosynthesis monooxygenase [Friedmanniomyces endolithicus]KAK0874561.1 putative ubiquinone biosynthesis monooxygenase [Friedmanniomyces endolithicus]
MASTALLRRLLTLPPLLRRSVYSSAATHNGASQPDTYDVVCIGGGPVGLSFVSALRSHPSTSALRVALIDSQDLSTARTTKDTETYSNRCSSLTPASLRFLKQIGAWEHAKRERAQPYHAMDVWDGVSGSKIHFDSVDQQQTGLLDAVAEMIPGSRSQASRRKYEVEDVGVATMCENANTTSALLQRLHELDEERSKDRLIFDMLEKTRVESIDLGPESKGEESLDLSQWPIVTTSHGRIAARLLVGADGANSPVRQFADIPSPGWDYNQHGVVATLDLDQQITAQNLRTAYQRFLPTGPVALLPLPGNKASLVWSTTPQHAAKLKTLSRPDFTAAVNAAFRLMPFDISYMLSPNSTTSPTDELTWRESATPAASTGVPRNFPRITSVQEGSIASFPLRMRHADTYTGHRIALIGDAAHTIHPLAGQGLNLGLADAESLAQRIAYGVDHGMDVGSCWTLDGYNSDRWAKNNAVIGVVDKLSKIYGFGSGPVVWGRSAGVEVLERLGTLKGWMMGAAAGVK